MSSQNNNQKYNELGDQIKNSVLEALATGDFTGLSDSISKSVNTVIGDVSGQISRAASGAAASAATGARNAAAAATAKRYHDEQEARIQRNKQMRAQAAARASKTVRFNDHGGVGSVLGIIFGAHFAFYGLIGTLALMADFDLGGVIFSLILLATGVFALTKCIKKRGILKYARKLKDLVKENKYIALSEVEAATGYNHKTTVKKVREVLNNNFFPEGYIDEDETTFMASKAVYDQYLETKKHQAEQTKEELDRQGVDDEKRATLNSEQLNELTAMMSEGTKTIVRLHELNDEIPGETITAKLDKTEALLQDIFARVKEHPDQMKNCHKLMDYYLPTMLKLVEAYAEYDKVSEPGPDIIKAKDEIEKTIDTINGAFSELLNKLFRDSVWDVTADARVLQTMLGQDGLAKEE